MEKKPKKRKKLGSDLADGSGTALLAEAAVAARVGVAVAAVLAAFAAEPHRTLAAEVTGSAAGRAAAAQRHAAAAVQARRRGARLRVDLAAGAGEARPALALEHGRSRFAARAAVQTRLRAANACNTFQTKKRSRSLFFFGFRSLGRSPLQAIGISTVLEHHLTTFPQSQLKFWNIISQRFSQESQLKFWNFIPQLPIGITTQVLELHSTTFPIGIATQVLEHNFTTFPI